MDLGTPTGLEHLQRWQEAGLVDAATAERIRSWESERRPASSLSGPVRVAVGLGALLLGAGLLLFVSAHWDGMPPFWRFTLLVAAVLGLHGLASAFTQPFRPMAVALHAAGTLAFGGGVYLAAQIFHLQAQWSTGLLLWAIGAGLGWLLLHQWPQLLLLVLLTPAWLISEWLRLGQELGSGSAESLQVAVSGVLLLCLSMFISAHGRGPSTERQVLVWVGGLGLLPAALLWLVTGSPVHLGQQLPLPLALAGWAVAIAGPLLLSWRLQGQRFWPLALAPLWMAVELLLRTNGGGVLLYGWWGLAGLAFLFWGSSAGRPERINLGTLLIALTLLCFYFAEVMSRLGRSLSLVGLGLLFLAGGWALERLRRRMVARALAGSGP